jgi:Zn-dependent protease with chaperone function
MLESSPLQILNSHPPTMERVEHLEALWERANKKSGFVTLPAFAPQ